METMLIVTQFIFGILITIAVLLQKSSSVGLGAYSGSNESVFGAKGADGFLVKATAVLGILFVLNTVSLAYIYSNTKEASLTDSIKVEKSDNNPPMIPQAPKQ
ncbi:MAG: preprotein translocase subunit SecG [Helicobacteraceae bacterium]